MDAARSGQAMTDTAIDREIQAALVVDPSPEFLARVRTRIATEPARATLWLSWNFVAAVALATAIVAAAVVSRPDRKAMPVAQAPRAEDIRLPPPTAIEQPGHAPAPIPVASGPSTSSGPSRAPSRNGMRRKAARVRAEPELLLDPAETRALRRLIAGTREGTLDLSPSLQATTPTGMDLPPIDAIAIAPLTIDPLTPSGEEGVRP